MYVTIFTPGNEFVAGKFRANFQVMNGVPPTIDNSTGVTIAGRNVSIDNSSFDKISNLYSLYFTIGDGGLDGSHISIGLLQLLGLTTENVKLLSVDMDMNTDFLFPIGALILIFILIKVLR